VRVRIRWCRILCEENQKEVSLMSPRIKSQHNYATGLQGQRHHSLKTYWGHLPPLRNFNIGYEKWSDTIKIWKKNSSCSDYIKKKVGYLLRRFNWVVWKYRGREDRRKRKTMSFWWGHQKMHWQQKRFESSQFYIAAFLHSINRICGSTSTGMFAWLANLARWHYWKLSQCGQPHMTS